MIKTTRILVVFTILLASLALLIASLAAATSQTAVPHEIAEAENEVEAMRLAKISEETGLEASLTATGPDCYYDSTYGLYLCAPAMASVAVAAGQRDKAAAVKSRQLLSSLGLLLIPDSTNRRVMAFNPITGDLVNPNLIPPDTINLFLPKHAILSASGDSILVADQIRDVVQEYDLNGNYAGIFAPSVGVTTTILDNIRGMALRPNGNLLVTVGGGGNNNAVAEFDVGGNYLGNFIAAASGGLNSPFDIYGRSDDWLASNSGGTQALRRYELDTGAFITVMVTINSFPQQIVEAANGNVLVANFIGSQVGVLEYTAEGTLVDRYSPVTGNRGVYELPNGHILATNSSGVHEIDRNGNLVETKISGVSAQYIEFVQVTFPNITLAKTAGLDANTCATSSAIEILPGTDVTYCYEVTNTSLEPFSTHDLVDSELGVILSDFSHKLEPLDSFFVTQTVKITQTTVNTATWTASDGVDNVAQSTDTATVTVVTEPDITVEPDALISSQPPDAQITQVLTISNTGSADLIWAIDGEPATLLDRLRGTAGSQHVGPAWEIMAPLPSARVFNAVVADTNGYVYVIGGASDPMGETPTNTNYRYNTVADSWDTMAPMPAALLFMDGVAINNRIYIPGSEPDNNTYVYDIASDTWSTSAPNGGYVAPVQYSVVALDTDLYVLGGAVGGSSTPNVWILDTTTGIWAAGEPMQNSRISFSAAAIGGVIYVAGGVAFPGFAPDMTAEKYDGVAWSYIADLPDGGGAYTRWSYNADGHGLAGLWLAGGRRDADWNVLNHTAYYNLNRDNWTDSPAVPTLNQGRVYLKGDVATDGYFYVMGGRNPQATVIFSTNERLQVGLPCSPGNVVWVTTSPISGTTAPGESSPVNVVFDSTGLDTGIYSANLCIHSNDPGRPLVRVPLTVTVETPVFLFYYPILLR